LLFSIICLVWMHITITKMMNKNEPNLSKQIETKN